MTDYKKQFAGILTKHLFAVRVLEEDVERMTDELENADLVESSVIQYNNKIKAASADKSKRIATAREELKALFDEMARDAKKACTLDPGQLTDDIRLFESGMPLTADEVQTLYNKNSGNYTMQQYIERKANEMRISLLKEPTAIQTAKEQLHALGYMSDRILDYAERGHINVAVAMVNALGGNGESGV